jgi:predicted transposase YbfD/YdcC
MGKKLYKGSFFKHFIIIYDPRQEGKVRHKLIDILFIAVAASICYCNEWLDMEDWATQNEEWLRQYLELPNGIPSWYTIKRVFDVIDPKQFEKCFAGWVRQITKMKEGTVVAIDGKTMRGTDDEKSGKRAVHIVSAWCSENNLVMGQVKTKDKSNEITAIPELLDLLLIKGAIVTIDAMGCQKDIATKIAIHNFPEGLATFTSAIKDPSLGIAIAAAVAIHNIPEGIAVSMPIYYATGDKKKAFKLSFLSGLSEPVGAVIGYLILYRFFNDIVFGVLFALVAGIMVFISVDELLPTAREYGESHLSIYGMIGGMMVMAVSLLLFI